jgi:hypothetical protein
MVMQIGNQHGGQKIQRAGRSGPRPNILRSLARIRVRTCSSPRTSASRLRRRIESILNYAKVRRWRKARIRRTGAATSTVSYRNTASCNALNIKRRCLGRCRGVIPMKDG